MQAHFSSDDDTQGLADSHTRSALRTTLARATTFEKKEQLLPASTLQGRLWRLVSPPKPDTRGHYDVDLYEVKDVLHEIPLKYEVGERWPGESTGGRRIGPAVSDRHPVEWRCQNRAVPHVQF